MLAAMLTGWQECRKFRLTLNADISKMDAGLRRARENLNHTLNDPEGRCSDRQLLLSHFQQSFDVHVFDQNLVCLQTDRIGCSRHVGERAKAKSDGFWVGMPHGTHDGEPIPGPGIRRSLSNTSKLSDPINFRASDTFAAVFTEQF